MNATPPRMTDRELQVWELIAQGLANKQIAAALTISSKTVEKHREKVFRKLGVHTAVEAAIAAVRHGLIKVEPA